MGGKKNVRHMSFNGTELVGKNEGSQSGVLEGFKLRKKAVTMSRRKALRGNFFEGRNENFAKEGRKTDEEGGGEKRGGWNKVKGRV